MIAAPIGTGKTDLAIVLGVEAVQHRQRVAVVGAADLVCELVEARAECTLTSLQQRILRVALLFVDELGFVAFVRDAGQLLFILLAVHYERRWMIVTTNLAFSEWIQVCGEEKLASTLLDGLGHHAQILTSEGLSYRTRNALVKRIVSAPDKGRSSRTTVGRDRVNPPGGLGLTRATVLEQEQPRGGSTISSCTCEIRLRQRYVASDRTG